MDADVDPLLQASVPVALVDNIASAQLLVTVTAGAAGMATGADCTVAAGLVQPLTVCVTV